MSLSLTQSLSAIGPARRASFLALNGTPPYTYSVRAGGAGGSINSSGVYTAPATVSSDPSRLYDTIQVRDSLLSQATAKILIATPLLLFCEILQRELGLDDGRVYLWDQKLLQPTDEGLYVAVSVLTCKPFGNTVSIDGSGSGLDAIQSVNMMATLDIDIISRGPAARDRKEEIILALASLYAQAQQEANSFLIGKLPPGSKFLNLSIVDGAAIPYRFKISVNLQYAVKKVKPVDYFDTFRNVSVATDP